MKIFITGGCGFIGSNFINIAIKNNCNILNYDKLTYAGCLDNLKSLSSSDNYKFIQADICDYNKLSKTILDYKPDAVIHFAAESHVDRSIDNPLRFIKTNIEGTANLLESALRYWKNSKPDNFKLIHISTDEVYGSLGIKGFFTEKTAYDPSSPYSASKASSDHLARAWHKTYGLPLIITNCSNNYGPFQYPEKLIPLMIANCIDDKPLPIYGKGNNIRDWLFVNDHCEAILKVLNDGIVGHTYNIGGFNELKNIDIVNTICRELDTIKPRSNGELYEDLIIYVKDRPGHDLRYAIDSSKIKNDLNWAPKETFESGIKKTILWYINNESWWRKIQKKHYNQERLGLKDR